MKVAIDIRRVRDYGPGTYTRNLITTLAELDRENSYLLVGTSTDAAELPNLPENFSLLEFGPAPDGVRHDLRLGWRLRRQQVDLCHIPYLTPSWMVPCRRVVTVHDAVEFLDLPAEGISLGDLLYFHRTRLALLRARRILAVSQATRRDLQRLFGLPGEKIEVIYNALDTRINPAPAPEEIQRTLSRYSVHSPYLLYAGKVKPHKNLPRLIEAFSLVRDQLRKHARYADLKLIIIGEELHSNPQLRRAVVKSRTQEHVRFLGFVPPNTLSVFYTRAEAFVFPSLYEGFGLPPLEAMALGTPVVASNVSSLPEVLGEAAVFVNPVRVFDISRGILQILQEENLRQRLIQLGFEQVRRFSWRESVGRILEVYRAAVSP